MSGELSEREGGGTRTFGRGFERSCSESYLPPLELVHRLALEGRQGGGD